MKCKRCNDEMSSYLDGELSIADARDLESHIRACAPCAAELQSLETSSRFVANHSREVELRPQVWQKVSARVAESPEPQAAWSILEFLGGRRLALLGSAITLALLLMAGGWGVLKYRETERALVQYMADCIHVRDAQEEAETAQQNIISQDSQETAEIETDAQDNPFSSVSYDSDDNPFRSEDQ